MQHSQVARNAKNIVVRKQESANSEVASARAHRKHKLDKKITCQIKVRS